MLIQFTIQTKILQPAIIQNTNGAYSRPFKCSQPTLTSQTTGLYDIKYCFYTRLLYSKLAYVYKDIITNIHCV